MAQEWDPERPAPVSARQTADAAAPVVTPHPLYALQGQAGNAAVGRLVQRQAADGDRPAHVATPDHLLDDTEVAKATAFYANRPKLYSPPVIQDLRRRLELDPAGGIDADLVQAIARFQFYEANDPELTIDGMAGPRSLPRLFRSGLAQEGESPESDAATVFGAAAQAETFDNWDALGTAEARAEALVEAANRRLEDAAIPKLTATLYTGKSPEETGFHKKTWAMRLDPQSLDQSAPGPAQAAQLASTVYHEARRAEQHFWMACYLSYQGYSAGGIAHNLGLKAEIAELAMNTETRPDTPDMVIAASWYESEYGSGKAHMQDVRNRLKEAEWAVIAAECRCKRSQTPANKALLEQALQAAEAVEAEYRQLPTINDAIAVSGKMDERGVTGDPNAPDWVSPDPCETLRQAGRPVPAAETASVR